MNETETKEESTTGTEVGMRVVLNGGKEEMNSATLPIAWGFSDEVLEERPEHIVIIEQTKREAEAYDSSTSGRRRAFGVKEKIGFIQIFSPGHHRIIVLALAGENSRRTAEELLDRSYYSSNYKASILTSHIEARCLQHIHNYIVAAAIVEFVVPKELFAKKPEMGWQKVVWNWVNLLFKSEPHDQCHFRRRAIFAFTLQIPIVLTIAILTYGLVYPLSASYVLLGSGVALFCGYRPKRQILKRMGQALTGKLDLHYSKHWRIRRYDSSDYRVWEEACEANNYQEKLMLVTPFEVAASLASLCAIIWLWNHPKIPFTFISWLIAVPVFLITFCVVADRVSIVRPFTRLFTKISLWFKAIERKAEVRFREQFWKEFSIAAVPQEINYRGLLFSPKTLKRPVLWFRIAYSATKVAVCKPYPK